MQEKILALAAGMTGAAQEEQELLAALCAAAERAWSARLKDGVSVQDCGEAFACAAAFTAAADFLAGCGGGHVESFPVGELSLKTSAASGGGQAEALRKSAERLMAPYAQAEDFCFRGVRG